MVLSIIWGDMEYVKHLYDPSVSTYVNVVFDCVYSVMYYNGKTSAFERCLGKCLFGVYQHTAVNQGHLGRLKETNGK